MSFSITNKQKLQDIIKQPGSNNKTLSQYEMNSLKHLLEQNKSLNQSNFSASNKGPYLANSKQNHRSYYHTQNNSPQKSMISPFMSSFNFYPKNPIKPIEKQIKILDNFLKEFCMREEVQKAYTEIKGYLENLEHQNNLNIKQNTELKHMNEYLQVSLDQKQNIYRELVKNKIENQQQLQDQDQKIRQFQKIHNQNSDEQALDSNNNYKQKIKQQNSPVIKINQDMNKSSNTQDSQNMNSSFGAMSKKVIKNSNTKSKIQSQRLPSVKINNNKKNTINQNMHKRQQSTPVQDIKSTQQEQKIVIQKQDSKEIDLEEEKDDVLLNDNINMKYSQSQKLILPQKKRSSDITLTPRKIQKYQYSYQIAQDKIDCAFENARVSDRRQTMSLYLKNEDKETNFAGSQKEFKQHNNDFQLFAKLLDLSDNDSDEFIIKNHVSQEYVDNIRNLVLDESKFRKFILNIRKKEFYEFYEGILIMIARYTASFKIILKLKNIIKGMIMLNGQLDLGEAFKNIIEQTCKAVNCDRASVFLVDKKRNELWTKLAKGHQLTIRVQLGQGLAGYVGKTGEVINVLDAHQDNRFNKESDRKSNYRTKSVLCVPIFKNQNYSQIIGVLQAINKDNHGFFTKNDEGLIKILAALAEPILRVSVNNEQKIEQDNRERQLYQLYKSLNQCKKVSTLLLLTQKKIETDFDFRQSRIFIHNKEEKKLIFYEQDGTQKSAEDQAGLAGIVFNTKKLLVVSCCYNHNQYNSLIDIDTNMPVITLPIKNHKNKKEVIGVMQVVNQKGIENMVYSQSADCIPRLLDDTLDDIADMISQITYNINTLQNTDTTQLEEDDQQQLQQYDLKQ